jgi:hypothetical protein
VADRLVAALEDHPADLQEVLGAAGDDLVLDDGLVGMAWLLRPGRLGGEGR